MARLGQKQLIAKIRTAPFTDPFTSGLAFWTALTRLRIDCTYVLPQSTTRSQLASRDRIRFQHQRQHERYHHGKSTQSRSREQPTSLLIMGMRQ